MLSQKNHKAQNLLANKFNILIIHIHVALITNIFTENTLKRKLQIRIYLLHTCSREKETVHAPETRYHHGWRFPRDVDIHHCRLSPHCPAHHPHYATMHSTSYISILYSLLSLSLSLSLSPF